MKNIVLVGFEDTSFKVRYPVTSYNNVLYAAFVLNYIFKVKVIFKNK